MNILWSSLLCFGMSFLFYDQKDLSEEHVVGAGETRRLLVSQKQPTVSTEKVRLSVKDY